MLKLKPFRQTPGMCGPASLKIAMEYWGVAVKEQAIAQAAGATKEKGVTTQGLVKAAHFFGFEVLTKKNSTLGDLKRFAKKGVPVIVDWFSGEEGHYSVVAGLDKKNIVLMDPELPGKRTMSQEKFLRVWFDFPGKFIRTRKDVVLRLMLAVRPFKK